MVKESANAPILPSDGEKEPASKPSKEEVKKAS
jgi:hypothetical protein